MGELGSLHCGCDEDGSGDNCCWCGGDDRAAAAVGRTGDKGAWESRAADLALRLLALLLVVVVESR